MAEIVVHYKVKEAPEIYTMTVPRNITCKDFLKKINEKTGKEYIAIFHAGSTIDEDDQIVDYWEGDNKVVFLASLDEKTPTPEESPIY